MPSEWFPPMNGFTPHYYMGPCTPTETTKQGYKFKDDKAIEITNFLII